ncbi:S8 family peptidase [Terrimonas pollutisoli]|uniref:S8 family peptidase n=1 Tax=Terrimonas pollutisoli TaxID=3034147 RepID=UPI0023EC1D32|nr:S8 family serine peptidase [Terrimonas sp. H1YJ31]
MTLNKLLPACLLTLVLFYSCKKSANDSITKNPGDDIDDCVQTSFIISNDTLEGQYIVVYKTSAEETRTISSRRSNELNSNVLERHHIARQALKRSFEGRNAGFVARLSSDEAKRLAQDETVAAIEPDRIISLGTCFTVAAPRLITWNINRVGYGNGIGKRAWIIDTGIDFAHPDLTVDATLSKSFISGQSSAEDENGHGTHIAGIIGAKNNTFGVLGVASGATLISLRVLDKDGKGLLSNIINALAYVSSNASAGDVVNLSVGDEEGISTTLDQQVKNTAAKGIYISIAAGNEKSLANKYSPARANAANVYTVSAVDSLDNFAKFSNYGNDVVDFAAPGVRILSTFTNGRYAYLSGTSMAAPHVAGLLLLRGNAISSAGSAKNDPDGQADLIAHY